MGSCVSVTRWPNAEGLASAQEVVELLLGRLALAFSFLSSRDLARPVLAPPLPIAPVPVIRGSHALLQSVEKRRYLVASDEETDASSRLLELPLSWTRRHIRLREELPPAVIRSAVEADKARHASVIEHPVDARRRNSYGQIGLRHQCDATPLPKRACLAPCA